LTKLNKYAFFVQKDIRDSMIHHLLKNIHVVLASESPRRKELFKLLGIKFIQKKADIDETILPADHLNPRQYVCRLAIKKCQTIAEEMDQDCLIVAADTIVYHKKHILGKPENEAMAFDYLNALSEHTHAVYTGICVRYKMKNYTSVEKTSVSFKKMSEQEIRDYIATGEPMDKAGAYGIQGYGAQFIEKVNGCYFNVMGFPVHQFYCLLEKMFKG